MENVVGEEGEFGHVEKNGCLLLVKRVYENAIATNVIRHVGNIFVEYSN